MNLGPGLDGLPRKRQACVCELGFDVLLMIGKASEHAVHKARAAIGAELLGQLNGLVYGNLDRCPSLRREFPAGHTQDVAIDSGDLIQGPLGRVDGEDTIEFVCQRQDTKNDLARKFPQFI